MLKTVIRFTAPAFAETMQGYGVPLMGETFDPMDYAMYGAGVFPAVIVEKLIIPRVFPSWVIQEQKVRASQAAKRRR